MRLPSTPVPRGAGLVEAACADRQDAHGTEPRQEHGLALAPFPDPDPCPARLCDGGGRGIEVGNGLWAEESYGCYRTYSYEVLVWNGYSGQMCAEDEYDPQSESCQ